MPDAVAVKPSPWAWIWDHRRTIAPFVGVALALLCPHLGPAAKPCAIVGDVVSSWKFNNQPLP